MTRIDRSANASDYTSRRFESALAKRGSEIQYSGPIATRIGAGLANVTRYEIGLFISAVTALAVFVQLLFVAAPYGRHARRGWGPAIPNKVAWIIMEGVAALAILYFFLRQRPAMTPTLWLLLGLWELHYVNRAFLFPLRTRTQGKSMPVAVALMAMAFNTWNGFLNGHWLGTHAADYTAAWTQQPSFIAGLACFAAGLGINLWSDEILLRLRRGSGPDYSIPRGGLFGLVSCPNYFGELVEWTGWALMTWSPAGLVFALWTAANLVPRARSHHRWYRANFPDYPPDRRAIIPFIY